MVDAAYIGFAVSGMVSNGRYIGFAVSGMASNFPEEVIGNAVEVRRELRPTC